MKLYEVEQKTVEIGAIINNPSTSIISNEEQTIDKYLTSLEKHIDAFNSLSIVFDQIVTEDFSFIDKGNYILYNEYIKNLTRNLGMKHAPVISQEAISILPTVAINHHISLEGFIKDVWEKIKALFNKIINAIKEFFKKHFTRVGRLKKRLKNILEVLKETDKDLSKIVLENVPSGLASKYPVDGEITLKVVEETFNNVSSLGLILKNINDEAIKLANKDILSRDFVSRIRNLKDSIRDNKEKIEENNAKKGWNPLSKKNRELNKENKSLSSIIKDTEEEVKNYKEKVDEITSDPSNVNIEFDDKEFLAAQKEFEGLIEFINTNLSKLKDKRLVGGKVITNITVDKDSGLEVEVDENKGNPSEVHLGNKSNLIRLISETIKLINEVETSSKAYGKVNDTILNNINTVDRIIKDIDAVKMEELGKYRAVLTNKVKERLNLLKKFFTNYNKVCKSLFTMVVDAAEGNCDYAILSMKYFGENK